MQHSAGSPEVRDEHADDAVGLGAGEGKEDVLVHGIVRHAHVRDHSIGTLAPVTPVAHEVQAAA